MYSLNSLKLLIGNTPMAKIYFLYKDEPRILYAKLEYFNMTGSIKDRMALRIIDISHQFYLQRLLIY